MYDDLFEVKNYAIHGQRSRRINCKSENEKEVKEILNEDPLYSKKIAEYEIIEFSPTKYAEGFEKLI